MGYIKMRSMSWTIWLKVFKSQEAGISHVKSSHREQVKDSKGKVDSLLKNAECEMATEPVFRVNLTWAICNTFVGDKEEG